MKFTIATLAVMAALVSANGFLGDLTGSLGLGLGGTSQDASGLGDGLKLPPGLQLGDNAHPQYSPCDGCTDVYHAPHLGIDIDDCDNDQEPDWHYVHPGYNYPDQPSYTWGVSTAYATQVSTVVACPSTVGDCPADSTIHTTIAVPSTTTVCPVQAGAPSVTATLSYNPTVPEQPTYTVSAPAQPTYSASAPAQPTYTVTAPAQSKYSASAPAQPTYTVTAPAQPTYSASAPAQPTYTASAPEQPTYNAPPPFQPAPAPTTLAVQAPPPAAPTAYSIPAPNNGTASPAYVTAGADRAQGVGMTLVFGLLAAAAFF